MVRYHDEGDWIHETVEDVIISIPIVMRAIFPMHRGAGCTRVTGNPRGSGSNRVNPSGRGVHLIMMKVIASTSESKRSTSSMGDTSPFGGSPGIQQGGERGRCDTAEEG